MLKKLKRKNSVQFPFISIQRLDPVDRIYKQEIIIIFAWVDLKGRLFGKDIVILHYYFNKTINIHQYRT